MADYLEVMPKPVYQPLIDQEIVSDTNKLEEIIGNIVKLGKDLDIPVVATGDVHYLIRKMQFIERFWLILKEELTR